MPLGFLLQGIVALGDIRRGLLSLGAVAASNRYIRVDFGTLGEVTGFVILPLTVEAVSITQLVMGALQIGSRVTLRVTTLVRLLDHGVRLRQFIGRLRAFRSAARRTQANERPCCRQN